jgi:hypothetical protein
LQDRQCDVRWLGIHDTAEMGGEDAKDGDEGKKALEGKAPEDVGDWAGE